MDKYENKENALYKEKLCIMYKIQLQKEVVWKNKSNKTIGLQLYSMLTIKGWNLKNSSNVVNESLLQMEVLYYNLKKSLRLSLKL